MEREGIVDNARRIGADVLGPRLAELAERHAVIGEVRGEGVFWALELVADRGTREPLAPAAMGAIKGKLLEAGLLPFLARSEEHTSELQSLMRISYAVFCLKKKKKA